MSLSFPTYPLSKKYTDETVVGGGAIKGKNLVVTSIESITGGKRINVQWTLDDGTVQTDHVDLENGEDGKGIKSVAINAEEHLIITYTDDTTSDAGKIEIQSAVDSVNGETGDVVLEITDIINVGSNLTYNAQTKTLSADAQAQVQADWEQSDNTQADYIKNKPSLGTASEKDAINTVLAGSTSLPTGDAVKTAIDNAVSSAYHHAGTKTVAELTSALLVEANDGNVYNMTDSGVTTADFIEGAGKPIAIGDNVGIAKVGENTYKFDLLSGFVDTTLFIQKSSTTGLIKNDGTIDTTDYADKSEMSITDGTGADLGTSTIQLKSGTSKKVLTEHQDVTGKADKVQNATNNHIALLDGLGNLKDGGKAITDLIPNGGTTGQVLAKHSNTDGDVEWKDVQSGGHTIENASGTALTQRDTLQFKGGLSVSDDSTNEVTVVDDTVPEIEWSVWNAMTPQEQEAIPNAIILNAPDSGGGSSEDIQAIVNVYGSKNLNSYPYLHTTKSVGGFTYTDNEDGTITAEGIFSGVDYYAFSLHSAYSANNSLTLKRGRYMLNGCPSGGSNNTYYIKIWVNNTQNAYLDTGEGVEFEVTTESLVHMEIHVYSGVDLTTPITFKPMIRDARISDATYVPYAMTNKDLTNQKANKSDVVELQLTGTTNTSGSTITAGTWFYLNGEIVKAKVDIASNATFTKDTNYEEKTIGEELSELNSNYDATLTDSTSGINIYLQVRGKIVVATFSNIPCEATGSHDINLSSVLGNYIPIYYDPMSLGTKSGAQTYENVEVYTLDHYGVLSYYIYSAGIRGAVTFTYAI